MANDFSLKVVKPLVITPAMVTDSNLTEADYATYAAGTTYALAARVVYNHGIYESLQAANLGKTPDSNPTWWIYVSPTNKFKAFDTVNSTQTTNSTTIYYKIVPGVSVPSISALNLTGASSIRIKVTDSTYGVIYDTTTDLTSLPKSSDWWAWTFGTRTVTTVSVGLDIPSTPSATIEITLTGTTALAVGVILLGQSYEVGSGVKYGARVGIQDYSRKETNEWGDTVLTQRSFAKRATFDLQLEKQEVDSFYNFLAENRATPCLWIGTKIYESTIVFGFYKEFEIMIPYPEHCDCSLDLEGLT